MSSEAWLMLSGLLQAGKVIPEEQRAAPGSLPLTVIGGFLGAGKTTLVNRLLAEPHGRRIAVLVNDFGRINIDAALIRSRTADTIELANGCACCSVAGDLARTIVELAQREAPPEAIVVEASGLADPRGIVQVALANPALRLDGIVALVDAETVLAQAADPSCGPMLRGQVECADVIVLNKRDLVDVASATAARGWLEAQAPGRAIIEARHGEVPVDVILGIKSARGVPAEPVAADHAAAFESVSVTLADPLDRVRLREVLRSLPPGVVRVKGILCIADDAARRTVYQRVGARWSYVPEGPWEDGLRLSRLVAIALRGTLDAAYLKGRLEACVAP
ncbi:MAG TPA: GTP-binding protein [Ramlibacter sp.]|nr:GTP-binding protein [Ramlibacter sp.]